MDEAIVVPSSTKSIAERILSERFKQAIQLGEPSDLGGSARSQVLRFAVLDGSSEAPRSVIVKRTADPLFNADASNTPTTLFFNEWASLNFLEKLDPLEPFAPRFYGGDKAAGIFVMEDLGEAIRLDHLLLGSNTQAAENGLVAYARLHGRLHARSIARQTEYLTIREALSPSPALQQFNSSYEWLKPALATIAEQLQVAIPVEVDAELEALMATQLDPEPFFGFMQADSCPDNIIAVAGGWRMIDFEGAHYGHVLLEGAYCRMPMPTCWCVYRLPEHILQQAETAYRTELMRGCPEAGDDVLYAYGLVGACIIWMVSFARFMRPLEQMLLEDKTLTALSDRQRFLLYTNSAAQAAEKFQAMPETGSLIRAMAEKLSTLWPEAVEPPYYPAFR